MTEIDYLREAVGALTKPAITREVQDVITDGKVIGQQKVSVTLPPLLEQLDDAIRSSMGGTTAGASDPATRSILNIAALHKFVKISSQIMDCARMTGSEVRRGDASGTLQAWYVKFSEYPHEDAVEKAHERTLTGWANQIAAILDPPKESDLPHACPLCHAKTWWDPKSAEEYFRPLVIRYRPTGPDMLQQAKGMCRACGELFNVRELAYALEHPEAEAS